MDIGGIARKSPIWSFSFVAIWLANTAWICSKIGIAGTAWGLAASLVVSFIVVKTILWLGRVMPENQPLLISAFLWGASFAGFISIWSQAGLQSLVDTQAGVEFGKWFRPLVITPITEEVSKGMFLIWMMIYHRSYIKNLLNGIVFGGMIGAGFAFSEQIMYFGGVILKYFTENSSDEMAFVTLIMSFILRGVMVPFMHSFFAALIGIGVAASTKARARYAQILIVLLGFLLSIVLHGVWDWAGLAGEDRFMIFKLYFLLMLPLFIALSVFSLICRHRQKMQTRPT